MKEVMTVHKALCELKVLGDRIDKEIDLLHFLTLNKHGNQKINGVPVKDHIENVRANYKSVMTLINRRNAIKGAVINSNAVTKVVIGGKEYTVAEAIDMKANGMSNLRKVLGNLELQWNRALSMAERENGEKLDARADAYVKSLYEGSDMKNLSDDIQKVRETFVASQTVDIIDPIGAQDVMRKLKDEIDTFMADVDSALSVSNALTYIDIEYETL